MKTYKGYIIEINAYGMYTARLENSGYYGKADTLAGIKRLINQDIKTN